MSKDRKDLKTLLDELVHDVPDKETSKGKGYSSLEEALIGEGFTICSSLEEALEIRRQNLEKRRKRIEERERRRNQQKDT